MATKLRKLQINEVSICDVGANPHARVALFKRDSAFEDDEDDETESLFKRRQRRSVEDDEAGRYGRAPKGRDDQHFKAGGVGPVTDRLWVLFDNHRRSMPGSPQTAFALAWDQLDDGEKQAIRNEEAAAEAAKQAQVDAQQREREQQMTDEGVMIKGARAVARGELENTIRKSTWHSALRKMADDRREDGETIERAVARLVKTDADALALLRASLSGVVDDAAIAAPVTPAPVAKFGGAYAQLRTVADEMCRADASLTRHTAIAKIAADPKHRELWEKAKRDA